MPKPKKRIVKVAIEYWCTCPDWKEHHWLLANHQIMNFCVYCGSKLVKEKTTS